MKSIRSSIGYEKIYEEFKNKTKKFEDLFYKKIGVDIEFSTNSSIYLKTKYGKIRVDYDGAGILKNILIKRGKNIEKIVKECFKAMGVEVDNGIKQECDNDTKETLGYSYYFPVSMIIKKSL